MPRSAQRKPQPHSKRHYASIVDAADYLGCEHKLVRKMISAGKITGYRIPGSRLIRVDLNELDEIMAGDAA